VADILSEILDKKVVHNRLTYEAMVDVRKPYTGEDFARSLGDFEVATIKGADEALFQRPDVIRGKVTVRDVIEANKEALLS